MDFFELFISSISSIRCHFVHHLVIKASIRTWTEVMKIFLFKSGLMKKNCLCL